MLRLPLASLLLISITACTAHPFAAPASGSAPATIKPPAEAAVDRSPVKKPTRIPSGRYTLIDTSPRPEQVNLLQQVVDLRIPSQLTPKVEDALKHALQRSGYALCPSNPSLQVLYTRPLPAAHYRIGPMPLRDALQVIAGSAWQLQANKVTRTVCFQLREGLRS